MNHRLSCLIKLPHEVHVRSYSGDGILVDNSNCKGQRGLLLNPFASQESWWLDAEPIFNPIDDITFPFSLESTPADPTLSFTEYNELFSKAQQAIIQGQFEKLVLSRIIYHPRQNDVLQSFKTLCSRYPRATVYLLNSSIFGVWIGATPEVLMSGNRSEQFCHALAGTRWKNEEMPWGEKELREQRLVAEYIESVIQSSSIKFAKSALESTSQGHLQHLLTTYVTHASLDEAIALAFSLHPTPAVSGLPKQRSVDWLLNHESHNRELYTGIIGIVDSDFLHLNVNLRCAKLLESAVKCYVGGGVTSESICETEFQETEQKSMVIAAAFRRERH